MYVGVCIAWSALFFVFTEKKKYYESNKCVEMRDIGLVVAIAEIIIAIVPLIILLIYNCFKAVITSVVIGVLSFLLLLAVLIALTYAYSLH